jgi:hypothetical protein
MKANHSLETYLTDHLAGAAAGVEIATRIAKRFEGSDLAPDFEQLVRDIAADRESLVEIHRTLGADRRPVKEAAAWVGEKLTRLKLSDPVTGDPDLTLMMELETLELGITGKLALWRALDVAFPRDEIGDFDLDELQRRADAQQDFVERHRIEAARTAFTT